jgi:hypothetical protein
MIHTGQPGGFVRLLFCMRSYGAFARLDERGRGLRLGGGGQGRWRAGLGLRVPSGPGGPAPQARLLLQAF